MLCIAVLSLACIFHMNQAIRLEENGYRDVVIAINDKIPEDASLIGTLKDVFTRASKYLHTATKKRAYFKEITIVVPESWPDKKTYASATAKEIFSVAKIRVNPPEIVGGIVSNAAFVEPGIAACGLEGWYMHLTPGRLTNRFLVLGSPPDRMIVHEWAHLRWGTYDEYFKSFFGLESDGKPGRCPKQIVATRDRRSGFWVYETNGATASIAWKQYYNDVVDFCDHSDDPKISHNREATNDQNRFCNMQSLWEVMRKTEDFANGANPPRDVNSTKPTFRVVRKKRDEAIVLVLDVSKGMAEGNRMDRLRQATKGYLDTVKNGTHVGVVYFANKAFSRKKNLFRLHNQKSRDRAARLLPTIARAKKASRVKSIAAGVNRALNILKNSKIVMRQIIVVTDGIETKKPYLDNAAFVKRIKESNVKINTIELGMAKTNLPSLSLLTGGMAFMDAEKSSEPSVLQDAMNTISSGSSALVVREHFTTSEMVFVLPGQTITSHAFVDPGLGRETTFFFYWSSEETGEIEVLSPKGRGYRKDIQCQKKYKKCTLKIPGNVPTGKWRVVVANKADKPVTLTYTVTSMKPFDAEDPIELETFITPREVTFPNTPVISATLAKGAMPIVDATIVAVVTGPTGNVSNILMHDNGQGTDKYSGDGSYSARFTQYSGDGSYNVKIIATADHTINRPMQYATAKHKEESQSRSAKVQNRMFFRDDMDVTDQRLAELLPQTNSRFEDTPPVEVPTFCRTESSGVFRLNEYKSNEDEIPPATVTDLSGKLGLGGIVELTWTAPGGDMETGRAARYKIAVSDSFDDLVDNFKRQRQITDRDVLRTSKTRLRSPQMSGLQEALPFRNPIKGAFLYVALKSQDQSSLDSTISNVVTIKLCACPERKNPAIKKALCNEPYVIYGTVEKSAGSTVTLGSSTEYIKSGFGLTAGFALAGWHPQLRVDLPKDEPQECDCPDVIVEGETYIMTATMNLQTFQLEVTGDSYVEKVNPGSQSNTKAQAKNMIKNCN